MSRSRRARARFPRVLLAATACLLAAPAWAFGPDLFGYRQFQQDTLSTFPQWVSVLERHLRDDLRDGDCGERRMNRCHMGEWLAFLQRVRGLPPREQLEQVNRYANAMEYVLDRDNYGVEDYWAIPREFLARGGDCEDYAITKFFSLRWLGYATDEMRIVVVQDTNLRVPHAVLAVARGDEVLILDSQTQRVVPQREIVHYAPVYSINEHHWWLHTPR